MTNPTYESYIYIHVHTCISKLGKMFPGEMFPSEMFPSEMFPNEMFPSDLTIPTLIVNVSK